MDGFKRGWLHFEQAASHRDPVVGERGLSVAVVEDGVVFTVVTRGLPDSCTISFEDYDLLAHFVEVERDSGAPKDE